MFLRALRVRVFANEEGPRFSRSRRIPPAGVGSLSFQLVTRRINCSSLAISLSWLLIAACGLACAQSGPTAEPQAQVTIPFTVERGEIYVPAFVNGRGPFRFVVDSGASGAGRVDVRLVEQLRLHVTGTTTHSDLVNTSTITTVGLDSLRIGALERRDVEVLSRDYNVGMPPDSQMLMGIIGRDFFAGGLLTIDYGRRELTTAKASLSESDPNVVRYDEPFVVPIRIGEHATVGHLDTVRIPRCTCPWNGHDD